MTKYDLYRILKEELKNGSSDLVTRPSGQVIRERIERDVEQEKDGTVVALDFSNIGVVDYSCADEIVAKLVSRLLGNEYGDKYLMLTGLNDNQRENIEVALERKDLPVMAEMRNGERVLLGNLNNYLKETLELVEEEDSITAKYLSEVKKLGANTSGTRLLNLHKKRLVIRNDEQGESGRVLVYKRI